MCQIKMSHFLYSILSCLHMWHVPGKGWPRASWLSERADYCSKYFFEGGLGGTSLCITHPNLLFWRSISSILVLKISKVNGTISCCTSFNPLGKTNHLSFNTYLFPDNFILSYLAYIGIIFLFCFVFHHPQEFLSLQYFYQYITLYKHIYIYMSSLSKVPVYHICLQVFKQTSYTLINNTSAYSNKFSNILIITHPPHSSPCSYSLGLWQSYFPGIFFIIPLYYSLCFLDVFPGYSLI